MGNPTGTLPGLGRWGDSLGTAMQGEAEQTNLWEQSTLLDLVGAPALGLARAAVEPAGHPSGASSHQAETENTCVASPEGNASATAHLADAPERAHDTDRPQPDLTGQPSLGAAAASQSMDPEGETAQGGTVAAASPPASSWSQPSEAAAPAPAEAQLTATPLAATPEAGSVPAATAAVTSRLTVIAESTPAAIQAAPDPIPSVPAGLPDCPQRLLILDTETTGLNPEQGQCIEVGAVLFDVASRAVLLQVSFLMPCERNPAEYVNGIPAAVTRLNQPWRSGLSCFEAMVADADALLAHNAAFDRQWFGNGELPALEKPWICSMEDIRWPAERHLRPNPSVRDLALAFGVPVWAAHRALTDCIYLVQVFERCDDLEGLLQAALEPRRLVRARLSYDERQLAKEAGFRWNEPVPKAWSRRLSEREIAALPFAVDPVEVDEHAEPDGRHHNLRWRRSA